MELERQISYYDKRWSETFYPNSLDLIRCNEVLRRLASAQLSEPSICDLGCGAGWFTNVLSSFGPTLGIDFSHSAIRNAAERYPSASFLKAVSGNSLMTRR